MSHELEMSREPEVVERFRALFNSIEPGTLPDLSSVYGIEVRFQDPFTEIGV